MFLIGDFLTVLVLLKVLSGFCGVLVGFGITVVTADIESWEVAGWWS